jgi:aminomethyltransferase
VIGQSYPSPGALANKYLGSNLRPLLEVVCDTVGRHDTLGLACTAKYYADLGYPGHPNCTDNFNTALSPYGVEPRAGWPAWNLFYNTALGPGGEVTFDEPWSRPGDFVLLRALDDLVVASSSCADDISPANGWWPTDIQVRVYRSDERFPRAKAHRVTPNSPPRLTRESGFQPRTALLTRRFDELHEFWVPGSYTGHGPVAEYWACRERVGMIDLSPLRKFEVVGPDAESLLQATLTRDVRRLPIGRVCYTALCNVTGGMIDDATCFRLGPDNFRLVGGEDYDGIWLREQAERMGLKVWVRDATEQISNLAVQGPASRDLLRPLVWTPPAQPTLDELTYYGFTIGRLGGERGVPVLVSRTGYSGELGYEVWCHPGEAVAVWDLLWEAGQPFGLLPFGLEALDLLRIEAGLPAGGHEFSDQIDPQEAGVGWIVALGKQEDFIGKAALQRRLAHPRQALVGLELEGNEVAGHGDGLLVGRDQVGVVTSGVRSPILHRSLALARLAVEFTVPGTQVEVGKLDGHQKRIAATVVRIPFYDPDKTRPRS